MPKLREMMSESGIALGNATVDAGTPDQRQAQDEQPGRAGSRQRRHRRGDGNAAGRRRASAARRARCDAGGGQPAHGRHICMTALRRTCASAALPAASKHTRLAILTPLFKHSPAHFIPDNDIMTA